MRFVFTILTALILSAGTVLADAGHSHGNAAKYDGHATALGEAGDPKARNIRTIEVAMTDRARFRPAKLTVQQGGTIRFLLNNTGETKHEFVLGTPNELTEHATVMQKFPEMEHDDPNAISVEPGKVGTLVWKFTKAGEWDIDFACLIPGHFEGEMKGRIVVR